MHLLIAAANARGWPVLLTVSGALWRWRPAATSSRAPALPVFRVHDRRGPDLGGKVATWSI